MSSFDIATTWDSDWKINGKRPKKRVNKAVHEAVISSLDYPQTGSCPYCSRKLRTRSHKEYAGKENKYVRLDEEPFGETLLRHYILSHCIYCGYWIINGYDGGSACMDPIGLLSAASVTAKFEPNSPNGCSEELAQHLRRNPELWHRLAPHRMETLVADIFKASHKHCEVKHVGQPGDKGVDVLYVDDNNTNWLIQVKRREKPNKPEGFETLQRILGTLSYHNERHGIIVSTADYFTSVVKKDVKHMAQFGCKIELIDKGVLNRIVGSLIPSIPWKPIFSHPEASRMHDLKTNFTKFYQDTVAIGNIKDRDAENLSDLYEEPRYFNPNQLSLF